MTNKHWIILGLIILGTVLLTTGVTIGLFSQKVNKFKKENAELKKQRDLLFKKADSLKNEILLTDESVEDRLDKIEIIKQERDEILDHINNISSDSILELITTRFNINTCTDLSRGIDSCR